MGGRKEDLETGGRIERGRKNELDREHYSVVVCLMRGR